MLGMEELPPLVLEMLGSDGCCGHLGGEHPFICSLWVGMERVLFRLWGHEAGEWGDGEALCWWWGKRCLVSAEGKSTQCGP